jgi:hypothetical protein
MSITYFAAGQTGKTLKLRRYSAAGQIWNSNAGAFETFNSSNLAAGYYGLTVPETPEGSGLYSVTVAEFPDGRHYAVMVEQRGSVDSIYDTVVFGPAEVTVADNAETQSVGMDADALLDHANAVDGKTLRQSLRIMAAMLAGKVSGAGSGTERFNGLDGSTPRVEVATDAAGNRLNVTYDPV